VGKTLPFTVETAYGADGLRIGATWQTVPTLYALKGDSFQEEYAGKQLNEKQLKSSLRKSLGQQ
jgi:hypothetical protein